MSSHKRLFVGNLPPTITEQEISQKLEKYGDVVSVEIKRKANSVFAFVELAIQKNYSEFCLEDIQQKKWKGHNVRVELAKENFMRKLEQEIHLSAKTMIFPSKYKKSTQKDNLGTKLKDDNELFQKLETDSDDVSDSSNQNGSVKMLPMFQGIKSVSTNKCDLEYRSSSKPTVKSSYKNEERKVLSKFEKYSNVWNTEDLPKKSLSCKRKGPDLYTLPVKQNRDLPVQKQFKCIPNTSQNYLDGDKESSVALQDHQGSSISHEVELNLSNKRQKKCKKLKKMKDRKNFQKESHKEVEIDPYESVQEFIPEKHCNDFVSLKGKHEYPEEISNRMFPEDLTALMFQQNQIEEEIDNSFDAIRPQKERNILADVLNKLGDLKDKLTDNSREKLFCSWVAQELCDIKSPVIKQNAQKKIADIIFASRAEDLHESSSNLI